MPESTQRSSRRKFPLTPGPYASGGRSTASSIPATSRDLAQQALDLELGAAVGIFRPRAYRFRVPEAESIREATTLPAR
jgi:hypothetical protein